MHRTGTKHIVRHMQKFVVQWSVISKFNCIEYFYLLFLIYCVTISKVFDIFIEVVSNILLCSNKCIVVHYPIYHKESIQCSYETKHIVMGLSIYC